VDCSITTGELQELLQQYGSGDLSTAPAGRADNLLRLLLSSQQQQQQQPGAPLPEPLLHAQPGSSGGYADFIFAAAAQQLMGVDVAAALAAAHGGNSNQRAVGEQQQAQLPFKVLRNADLQELQLQGPDGRPLLRFARAYGFRNIQTIVRALKAGRCAYDYVEVMACPSGCLNGGGQLKPPAGLSAAQLVDQLERAYVRQQLQSGGRQQEPQQQQPQQQQQQQPLYKVAPGVIQVLSDSVMQQQQQQQHAADGVLDSLPLLLSCVHARSLAAVYQQLLGGGGPGSPAAQALLHTQYHERPKTVASALSDW
jgi:iron only hydrogenase large subunit-like protein